MFTLHVFLACFCDVYIQIVYGPLEGDVDGTEQVQQALDAGSISRSTSVRCRCLVGWRPDTVQPLYVSVQCVIFTRYPRRGEQICMSDHVCTHHLPCLCGASHMDAFWMVRAFSWALQLWLLHTLDTPPSSACLPNFIRTHFSHGQGSIPLGFLACCTFYYTDEASCLLTTFLSLYIYHSQKPQKK